MRWMQINNNVIPLIMSVSLLFALTAGCERQEAKKPAGPKEKVTIGVAPLILSLPVVIAQEKGYFADEGLDVTFKEYPFGKPAMEAMLKGEVDVSTVAETPIVFNSFVRDDYVVFGTFVYSYDDCKVLGRKDKGVSTTADLKGRKLGITAKTSSHFFAHIYLSEHNINLSSVTMVNIPQPDMAGALQSGKVDAIVAFEPYAYWAMKASPEHIVRLPQSSLFRETFNLTAMKKYAKEHPGALLKILKAIDRGISFIKQNRNASIAIAATKLKLEQDFLNSALHDFIYELSLDHALLTTLEDEARWAIKNKLTEKDKVPNYLDYFYLDALKAVKPEAVTIVK